MDWGVCDVKVDQMSWPNVQDESQALVDVTTDMRESNGLNSTRILPSGRTFHFGWREWPFIVVENDELSL